MEHFWPLEMPKIKIINNPFPPTYIQLESVSIAFKAIDVEIIELIEYSFNMGVK